MNRTAVLQGTGHFAIPAVLVVGGSLATLAVVGTGHHPTEAAAPRPAPTVTVTSTPAPVVAPSPARTTVTAEPSPGVRPAPAATIVSAAERIAAMPHTSTGGTSHTAARPPSAPQPSPSAASCGGGGLSVQVLTALCISLGR